MQAIDHSMLDHQILKEVIEGVEEGLCEMDLKLPADKKAGLIELLYKHFLTSGMLEKKEQPEIASTTEGSAFICNHLRILQTEGCEQLSCRITQPSTFDIPETSHEERLIYKMWEGKIESISLLLRPDHGIPIEYLAGAVLDYAMVTIFRPAEIDNCIRGQIISEDCPDTPLNISIPLSQIAGFEQSPKEVR